MGRRQVQPGRERVERRRWLDAKRRRAPDGVAEQPQRGRAGERAESGEALEERLALAALGVGRGRQLALVNGGLGAGLADAGAQAAVLGVEAEPVEGARVGDEALPGVYARVRLGR